MGSGTQRKTRGPSTLEQRGQGKAHYIEGIEGHPPRRQDLVAAVGRPQRPPARRRLGGMSHYDMPNLTLTGHEGRTTEFHFGIPLDT
jgi:hypothetical protein